MAADVTFYGFIRAQDTDWETFEFVLSDIYISELNKWLKADSPDAGKAFFNLEALKTGKSFAFYTSSESNARWALGEKRKLSDFFEYKKSTSSVFRFKLIAASAGFSAIVEFRDFEPVQTLLLTTPTGVIQSYVVKYKDARIEKLASHPGMKSGA